MKIEITKIGKVKPNPDNPRVLKDDKFQKLKKSIDEFPQMMELRPIVVDENMMILGGNMRYRACQDLKLKEVPVVKAENLTEEQKKEFIIKDNVSFGEWDWDALANDWDAADLPDWGLEVWQDDEEDIISDDEGDFSDSGIIDEVNEWGLVIICSGEREQMKMHEEMMGRGFKTRVINT